MLTDLADQLKARNISTGQAAGASIDRFFQGRLAESK